MFILCKVKNSTPLFENEYKKLCPLSHLFETRENSHVQLSYPYVLDFQE